MLAELTRILCSAIGAEPAAINLGLRRLLRITLRRHLSGVTLLRIALLHSLLREALLRITLRRHLSGVTLLRIALLHSLLREALLEALLLLHTHTLLLEALLHTLLRVTLLHVALLLHTLLRITLLVTGCHTGHSGTGCHTGYAAYGAHACVHAHTHARIRCCGSRLT